MESILHGNIKIGVDSPSDQGHTTSMKTAISIPKDVFDKAERLAKRARKSRSQLYCEAIREYVARHSPDEITEALDLAIEENGQPEDGFIKLASGRTLARVEW
jgi:predicted transcriptional regulator